MKTMISMAMATIAALCLSFNASARHGDGDKFKSEKIAFITTELNLTPAEAEKFWPVYNQLSQEKKEALKTVIDAYKALEKAVKDKASDAEINKLTRAYLDANNAFLAVDGKYLNDFAKVLPAEKVAKLYLSEEKFRRQQIHRLGKVQKGQPKGDKKAPYKKPGRPAPKDATEAATE